jgi:hypothetical protein
MVMPDDETRASRRAGLGRATFVALLVAATAVRVLGLPLPGTHDVAVWKTWSYGASQDPFVVYGVGGDPPVRGTVQYGDGITTVDYPPVALYELGLAGAAYRAIHPDYPDTWQLTAAVKLPGLLAGLLLTAGLYLGVRRMAGSSAARWAALAYWVNPATILNAEVLGYLDPLAMAPAVLAFVLVGTGFPALSAVALAIALLTKPQAILVGPAFALAVWRLAGTRGLGRATAAGGATALVVLLPYLWIGALPNMWLAFGSWSARRDIMSAYAANVW